MCIRRTAKLSFCPAIAFLALLGSAAAVQQEEVTPEEIGKAVGSLFVQAMADVVEALKDRPAAEEAISRLEEIKEKYIQKLVELGWKREALDETGREVVDDVIIKTIAATPRDLYNSFLQAHKHYMRTDAGNLIASFNIITQYANFDLLREQAPGEAERLGIL